MSDTADTGLGSALVDYSFEMLSDEGLKKSLRFVMPASDVKKAFNEEIRKTQETLEMPGFRKGGVPLSIITKNNGPQIMADLVRDKVDAILTDYLNKNGLSVAAQPKVNVDKMDKEENLEFTANIEVMPKLPEINWTEISVERPNIVISDADVEKSRADVLAKFKNFNDAPAGTKAKMGDAVLIDFLGKIDNKEFSGGSGTDIRLELGSDQFVKGFEEQLVGSKEGDKVKVKVVFPKFYPNAEFAGKIALFAVNVKKVMHPVNADSVDDNLAKSMGLESAEELIDFIKKKIEADYASLCRLYTKKHLFDKVDEYLKNECEIPETMLQTDYAAMMNEIKMHKVNNPAMFRGKTDEEIKAEYSEIARRRVRLGMLLAHVAKEANVAVTETDLQQAVMFEAMNRVGQEKIVFDYYSKPENLDKLQGPLLEEKVVDWILDQIKINDFEVSSVDFMEKYAPSIVPESMADQLKGILGEGAQ